MRVVVTGATGNVGTSLLQALTGDPGVDEIVGLARRRPELELLRTTWVAADVAKDDLEQHFRGADCVVHLAWLIQPSRVRETTRAVNVDGSRRVFEAAAAAGVPSLVHASSVGAYSPGPKDRRVDESWPTGGIPTSFYSRDKAEVERILDAFEVAHPDMRVVRLRPGLIFKGSAASGIRRLFAGPLLPSALLQRRLIAVVPAIDRLRFQAVHSLDVGEAYHRAVVGDVRGAFNVAAEPVLDPQELGRLLGARPVPVSARVLRGAVTASWKLRLQPTPPGWLDMALGVPLMDIGRAHRELGWTATRGAGEALLELLEGMRRGDGAGTPPLKPGGDGPARVRELLTGVGSRSR
ncbi:MAG TPA: NAD-dependent epimerase/dehydratase family protein [Solirubrobacteraceae bacterium]|jgi:nucleoside-diphosphate-sugar epimerase|nr:NAD-dependent epimerase/dehydratase family protein [Solirubrobacteraceae bacterium]